MLRLLGATSAVIVSLLSCTIQIQGADTAPNPCDPIREYFVPPAQFANDFGNYTSLLNTANGSRIETPDQWTAHRSELKQYWEKLMGAWPLLIESPKMEILSETNRGKYVEKRVRLELAANQMGDGYLLIPDGRGPFPAVFVPYYEPETSLGLTKQTLRDFGLQLARRGFVTLSIGSPGGDARKPPQTRSQPLHYLGYVSANCANALANLPQVDSKRIGVVGHSYGGKWAMFAACFNEKFACGVWSDPGIVFDEARPNVNYWEPWYLGFEIEKTRKPGVVTAENQRTGAYRTMVETKHDLTEVMALMAPRPFLVSGGSEDTPERWRPLNRVREVYQILGVTNRVGMTNRPKHDPTEESNEVIYRFFECYLKK